MVICEVLFIGCSSAKNTNTQSPFVNIELPSNCDAHFFQRPLSHHSENTKLFCFDGFALSYSYATKTALWVAEYLDNTRINQARSMKRVGDFYEAPQIAVKQRAWLSDYRGSGYDRGHLAPNGDMATKEQQFQSFSLINIVPQNHFSNTETWRNLEEATRVLARKQGPIYVITGPVYLGAPVYAGRVRIPNYLFKMIYSPKKELAGVYLSPNNASGELTIISPHQLQTLTNIDLLPALEPSRKKQRLSLPSNAHLASRFVLEAMDESTADLPNALPFK